MGSTSTVVISYRHTVALRSPHERAVTAQEPRSRYARESRVRVRSSRRGAGLALALAGACAALGWSPKLPLGLALFFAAVACLEWLNARYNERRAGGR